MSKHTPGPWEYDRMLLPQRAKDRRCGFVVNGPDTKEELPTRVCDMRVPAGIDGFGEGEANARLIAAAPELLEACEAMLKCSPMQQGERNGAIMGMISGAIDKAREAIAKAKGE
jgi:hypothetical protein